MMCVFMCVCVFVYTLASFLPCVIHALIYVSMCVCCRGIRAHVEGTGHGGLVEYSQKYSLL